MGLISNMRSSASKATTRMRVAEGESSVTLKLDGVVKGEMSAAGLVALAKGQKEGKASVTTPVNGRKVAESLTFTATKMAEHVADALGVQVRVAAGPKRGTEALEPAGANGAK